MLAPVEHYGEGVYSFDLHRGTRAATVESVIVGIDRHRQRIGSTSDGVWRLEHLPGVERVTVGVVVLKADCRFVEDGGGPAVEFGRGRGRKIREAFV